MKAVNGGDRLREALRRMRPQNGNRPVPGSPWECWAEERIKRLEEQQTWLLRAGAGVAVAAVVKLVMSALGLG